MNSLADRIKGITERRPEATSSEIAEVAGCQSSYVRTVWRRSRYPKRTSAVPRSVGVFVEISPAEMSWLKANMPAGSTINEFLRAVLNDTFAEVMG